MSDQSASSASATARPPSETSWALVSTGAAPATKRTSAVSAVGCGRGGRPADRSRLEEMPLRELGVVGGDSVLGLGLDALRSAYEDGSR